MDENQEAWLAAQLRAAPDNKALILSLHHPIYSFDDHHSGSVVMARAVEKAVRGMLPKNSIGRAQLTKLKVYTGTEHPHAAQQPKIYTLSQVAQ